MTFCKLNDDDYTPPKDRLPWEVKDMRPNKYEIKD